MGDAREPGRVVNPAMFGFDSVLFFCPRGVRKVDKTRTFCLLCFSVVMRDCSQDARVIYSVNKTFNVDNSAILKHVYCSRILPPADHTPHRAGAVKTLYKYSLSGVM